MVKRGRPKAKPMNPLIPSRITIAREQKGLSKYKLAKLIPCDTSAVRKWEDGTNNITEENLIRIAQICEVPLDWLKGESVPDIIQESIKMLHGFNPNEAIDYAEQISEQAEAESLAIIYALEMCGHNLSEIKDKTKFSEYMIRSISNLVETYISTLN